MYSFELCNVENVYVEHENQFFKDFDLRRTTYHEMIAVGIYRLLIEEYDHLSSLCIITQYVCQWELIANVTCIIHVVGNSLQHFSCATR